MFQVLEAAPNPVLQVKRYMFTPANSLINVTGRFTATINLHQTSFKNPFLKYANVTVSVDEPTVLSTQFKRFRGSPPQSIEFLHLQTIVNNTERTVAVNYTFELMHEYLIKDRTTLVLDLSTNLNGTKLSLLGEDLEGNEANVTLILEEAYEQQQLYFLYVKPIHDLLKTVRKVLVTHVCQPRGYFEINTVFRILNIFDDKPSIDSKKLVQGEWSTRIDNLNFPHRFRWEQLKAMNMSVWITSSSIFPETISTLNTLKYLWKVPDPLNVTIYDAQVILTFSRSIEAPIIQAEIIVEENGISKVIDFVGNITEAFSDQSKFPRLEIPIPNYGRDCQVILSYLYWSPLWNVIALCSLFVIMIDSIV
ncbi:hypothetical protein ES702_05365 [subsurface metagenome]